MSVEDVRHELRIGSEHTVADWSQFCRDIAVAYFTNNPIQIGGPGHVVEIDECTTKNSTIIYFLLSHLYGIYNK